MRTKQTILFMLLIGMLTYLIELERRIYPKVAEVKKEVIEAIISIEEKEVINSQITFYQIIK